jgi:hypothetical protein
MRVVLDLGHQSFNVVRQVANTTKCVALLASDLSLRVIRVAASASRTRVAVQRLPDQRLQLPNARQPIILLDPKCERYGRFVRAAQEPLVGVRKGSRERASHTSKHESCAELRRGRR